MSNIDLNDLLAKVAASAKQVNILTGDHASAPFYEAGACKCENKATDEQIFRAIAAINGKDKALKYQYAFLGVCCYLASRQKWPNNLEACASRVAQLDQKGEWYCSCKWESIRKLSRYGFALTDYDEWEEYKPNGTEYELFIECRDAARALDQQLQVEMQK